MNKLSTLITTAIISGLVANQSAKAHDEAAATGAPEKVSKEKHNCKGKHGCKGHKKKKGKNGCKGANACDGKNGCKGAEEKKAEAPADSASH